MGKSDLYQMGGNRPKGSTTRTKEEIIKVFSDKGLAVDLNQEIRNDRKITAYTKEGYKIEGRVYRIEQGIMPHIFGADTPYTIYNIREVWLPQNAPDYELLSEQYINNNSKLLWRLKDSHLPDFEMKWGQFQRAKRHPTLGRILGRNRKKATSEEMLEIIKHSLEKNKRFKGLALCIEDDYEYLGLDDIFIFKDEQGYLSCQTASAIRNGYSPQRYNKIYPETSTYNFYLWNNEYNINEKLLENQLYVGSNAKYKFICETHGIIEKWIGDAFSGVICRLCENDSRRGENHPLWNHEATEEERDDKRRSAEYRQWVKDVYERDQYACQCCGSQEKIVAHHKDGFGWCIERRKDVTNGIVLCLNCHVSGEYAFHKMFGNSNNTEQQFEEWLDYYQPLILQQKIEINLASQITEESDTMRR